MTPPDDFGEMPTGDMSRLSELCDKLEQAWKEFDGSPEGVDLEPILRTAGETPRLSVLYELIKTEMPHRHKNGLPWDLAFYLSKYPELGGSESLSPSLILEECLVRKRQGMQFSLASYQKRFAKQFPALEKLLHDYDTVLISNPAANPVASPAASPAEPAVPFFGISPGTIIANNFLVKDRLGRGAYGEVWKIVDTNGGIEKALKIIMHSMDTEEGKTEVEALEIIKNLKSPFILRPESFWVQDGRLLIVMELADGGSLRDCLKKHKQEGHVGIPARELLGYIREAADALDYLHRKNIKHRDIKPENILLVGDHAKVADMGLAKRTSGASSTIASALGSMPYMATEVWNNHLSSRSDQYSLVVTYTELRQGTLPFRGNTIIDFFKAHVTGSPQFVPGIILGAEQEVILKGLSKDSSQRFSSCSDFVEELSRTVPRQEKGPPPARVPTEPPPKKPTPTGPGLKTSSASKPLGPPKSPPSAPSPPSSAAGPSQPVGPVAHLTEAETSVQTLDSPAHEPPSTRPDTDFPQPEIHGTATTFETSSAGDKMPSRQAADEDNKSSRAEEPAKRQPSPPAAGPARRSPDTALRKPADAGVKEPAEADDSYQTIASASKLRSNLKPPEAPAKLPGPDVIEKVGRAVMDTEFGPDKSPSPSEVLGPNWKNQKAKIQGDKAPARAKPAVVDVQKAVKPSPPARPPSKVWPRLALLALVVAGLIGVGVMALIIIPNQGTAPNQGEGTEGENAKTANNKIAVVVDPTRDFLRDFPRQLAGSTNIADFQARLADIGKVDLDMEDRRKLLTNVKESWLRIAKSKLMDMNFLEAKNTAAALQTQEDVLLNEYEIALVKTISDAATQPFDTVGDKEKALPTWQKLESYDKDFRGPRQVKQTELVDSLLAGSKNKEMDTALASLQMAEKYVSDLPRTPDLQNQIKARRAEVIKQYRDPILQDAEVALKQKKDGARELLNRLRETDESLANKLKIPVPDDIRGNSLWALVYVQSNNEKEHDIALDYFQKVNEKENSLLDTLCRDFRARYENSASSDFRDRTKDILKKALHNLPQGDASTSLEEFLARIDLAAEIETALKSARGALASKDRAKLKSAVENLRNVKVDTEHEKDYFDLFASLAEEYVEGKVDFRRADLFALEKGKAYDVKRVFPRAMARYIKTVVQTTWPENKNDWKTRFEDCRLADSKDPWVVACIQECLLEDGDLGKEHSKLRSDIRDDSAYSRYVRGVATKNPAEFLGKDALDLASHPWFKVEKRRTNAATILKDAAKSLRSKDEFYEKSGAEQAYSYLVQAGKWLNPEASFKGPNWANVSPDFKLEMAFAALFKPEPDLDLGTKMASATLAQPGKLRDSERRFLRLITARSYKEIRDEIKLSPGAEKILDQALARAEAARGGIDAKRHAMLLAANGWVLLDPDSKGTSKDPKKAFEAFDKAFKLDPQSEYLVGRIDSKIAKTKDKTKEFWADLKKDADQLPSDQPSSHRLAARIELYLSRPSDGKPMDLGKRINLLERAYGELKQARGLMRDENWPEILYWHSVISLELGNYLHAKDKNDEIWKKYIVEASEFAETCWKDFPDHNPGEVQLALGHAREDLAHFCKTNEEANFAKAEKAFGASIATKDRWAEPWVARGRSLYRWSEFKLTEQARTEATKLRERALTDLTKSLNQDPSASAKAEAHFWIGVIAKQKNELQKAQKAFESAASDAKGVRADISLSALHELAELFLSEGRKLKQSDPKEAKKKADRAKEYIDELLKFDDSFESRNFLAEWGSLVLEALFKQTPRNLTDKSATDILKKALPNRDAKNATPYQVRLLVIYVDIQLTLEAKDKKQHLVDEMNFALECLKGNPLSGQQYNNLKADTYLMAATARLLTKPKDHRIDAVKQIRKAVEFGENHPGLVGFRFQLALQLYELMKVDTVQRDAYRDEAIEELDKALKTAPENYRSVITAKRKEIAGYGR